MSENTFLDFRENYLLVTFSILAVAYYFSNTSRNKKYKLPPGPRGIPLLGNLPGMITDSHLRLSEWANKYGKLMTIRMAHRTAMVVSDVKLMKELLGTVASTGKFKSSTFLVITQGPYGIVNSEGNAWQEQRNFCMKTLKEFGFGQSSSMEPLILDEAHKLCEWVRETKKSNEVIHLDHVLKQVTVNTLWTSVTGERFLLGDSEMEKLFNALMASVEVTVKSGLVFFSWLKYIAPKKSGYLALDKASKEIQSFIERKFAEHENNFVEGRTRNFIDVYIEKMKIVNKSQVEGQQSSFYGKAGRLHSIAVMSDLLIAGAESMQLTTSWAANYLSLHPQIQEKMQREIDMVLGRDRDPSLTDRLRMPYTEAVILETFRVSSVVLLGVPHELLEDITFAGYKLPKGLILMMNLYHMHHALEIWGDPENFRPERFLGERGQKLKTYLAPFQAGRRECPGAPFAKDVVFLILVKLLQQFNFDLDPKRSKEDYLTADVGVGFVPRNTGLVITERF